MCTNINCVKCKSMNVPAFYTTLETKWFIYFLLLSWLFVSFVFLPPPPSFQNAISPLNFTNYVQKRAFPCRRFIIRLSNKYLNCLPFYRHSIINRFGNMGGCDQCDHRVDHKGRQFLISVFNSFHTYTKKVVRGAKRFTS